MNTRRLSYGLLVTFAAAMLAACGDSTPEPQTPAASAAPADVDAAAPSAEPAPTPPPAPTAEPSAAEARQGQACRYVHAGLQRRRDGRRRRRRRQEGR